MKMVSGIYGNALLIKGKGATLQMGIGAIPDAVLSQLHNHKRLGKIT